MILFIPDTLDRPEKELLGELFDKYGKKMFSAAKKIVGNTADAEDAVQNAILSMAENMDRINQRETDKIDGYVIGIVKNEAYDLMRALDRTEPVEDDFTSDPFSDPTDRIFEREAYEYAVKIIRSMDDKYRTPLYLFCVMDRSLEEIARQLHISRKTAGTRVYRAKKLLAGKMKEAGYEF